MAMELKDIVMKLNGPIQPYGSSEIDKERLENIKELTQLVDELLYEINSAAQLINRPESSISFIAKHAHDYLKSLGEWAQVE